MESGKIMVFKKLVDLLRYEKQDISALHFYALFGGLIQLSLPPGIQPGVVGMKNELLFDPGPEPGGDTGKQAVLVFKIAADAGFGGTDLGGQLSKRKIFKPYMSSIILIPSRMMLRPSSDNSGSRT